MAVVPQGGGNFEKPKAGIYLGTVIDISEPKEYTSKNPQFPNPVVKVRVTWVLNATDSKGNPLRHDEWAPYKMTPPGKYKGSRMYEIASGVLGGTPSVPFDDEILIGRSNQLFIVEEANGYVKCQGWLPVPAGVVPPTAPAGFVRAKDKPKQMNAQTATAAAASFNANANANSAAQQVEIADEDIPF